MVKQPGLPNYCQSLHVENGTKKCYNENDVDTEQAVQKGAQKQCYINDRDKAIAQAYEQSRYKAQIEAFIDALVAQEGQCIPPPFSFDRQKDG